MLMMVMLLMAAGYCVVYYMQDNSLEEYTLEFGLLIHEATADEVEREYLAVMGRAKAVPSVEFDITAERVTNDCEPVRERSPGIMFSRATMHNPCSMKLEAGEYDWVAMARGTAKSTDRDALLAMAAEMHQHAYYLNVGESIPSDEWLLPAGLVAAAMVGVVLLPGCTWIVHHLLLLGVCSTIFIIPAAVVDIMNNQTYDNLLDMPAGTPPPDAGVTTHDPSVAGVPAGPDSEAAQRHSMGCTPVSGAGIPDGAVLCVS